jgi:hypothetical protein
MIVITTDDNKKIFRLQSGNSPAYHLAYGDIYAVTSPKTVSFHLKGSGTQIAACSFDGGIVFNGKKIKSECEFKALALVFSQGCNSQTTAPGLDNFTGLEFPQIELRNFGGILQYRILGKGISPKLAELNPRLVLFRRVRQNRDTTGNGRKGFGSKVQYVITRPNIGNSGVHRIIEFEYSSQPSSEGWITLRFANDNSMVTPESILRLFSFNDGTAVVYRRRSRNSVSIDSTNARTSNYFAQYYSIGFACDNPANSAAMNRRGQNLLYQQTAPFKAGVFRDIWNRMNFFFRVKTN